MNRIDQAIKDADDAVTKVTNRDLDREIGWERLGWVQYDNAAKALRRQNWRHRAELALLGMALIIVPVVGWIMFR